MNAWAPITTLATVLLLTGCTGPPNPTFDVTEREARQHLREMAQQPVPLSRPVVVVGPFLDPGISVAGLESKLRKVFGENASIIGQGFTLADSFDDCAAKTIAAVDDAFPNDDPAWTTEVDAIGFSMGGLVARHATSPRGQERRLRIARLFTISTPHQGARLAKLPAINDQMRGMRSGSEFLMRLHAAENQTPDDDYEIVAYTRYWDETVGSARSTPQGQTPRWVPNPVVFGEHPFSYNDPRFLADICWRLRNETPLTTDPPAPLPED